MKNKRISLRTAVLLRMMKESLRNRLLELFKGKLLKRREDQRKEMRCLQLLKSINQSKLPKGKRL
jgi:hypothetical protein